MAIINRDPMWGHFENVTIQTSGAFASIFWVPAARTSLVASFLVEVDLQEASTMQRLRLFVQ
jgi:hypothetical protein